MTKVHALMSSRILWAVMLASMVALFGLTVDNAGAISTGTLQLEETGIFYGEETGLGTADVRSTLARIIRVAMGLLGIVAVVVVLIGGFTWMTAGGNEEKVAEAKKWIFSGIIGLAIILSAYAIARFVVEQLYEATIQP